MTKATCERWRTGAGWRTRIVVALALAASGAPGSAGCGCGPKSPTDAGPPPPAKWATVCSGMDDFVLSVWAPNQNDTFFVGGNAVEGRALLLRLDTFGGTWVRTVGVSTEVLWWVWGTSVNNVWAVGENGEALHYDGGLWERIPTPTTATLYGVWGTAADAVWAVGGSVDPVGPKDVFLFWNGTSWLEVPPAVRSDEAIFKVWGAAADDVWAIGTGGVIFHWDGSGWTRATSPTGVSLLTVFGSAPDDVWAVGGTADGLLLHWDGAAWTIAAKGFSGAGLNGVYTEPNSSTIVVGHEGYAARFTDTGVVDPMPTGITQGLHAVIGDGFGLWAVGGNLLGAGTGPGGVILRYGTAVAECSIIDFMQPVIPGTDGGVDAGPDNCPGGTGSADPGEVCGSGRDCQCTGGTECWWISVCWIGGPRACPPSGNAYSHFICTAPCGSDADCQDLYGAGACCIVPGKQTTTRVCVSPGYMPVDGDVCD